MLSEIITRNDDKRLANKVNEYNKGLAQLCIEQNWSLIKHNNISINHLNNYRLHLNKQGTSAFLYDKWGFWLSYHNSGRQ